jgi:hypothetical protein
LKHFGNLVENKVVISLFSIMDMFSEPPAQNADLAEQPTTPLLNLH